MSLKLKLLDYSLICVIASLSTQATAQTQEPASATPAQPAAASAEAPAGQASADAVSCGKDGCGDANGLVMRVYTRGEREPSVEGANPRAAAEVLQPDRRVEVSRDGQPGRAVATGKWSAQLPGGGVIWATEDPNLGQPELNVSAPSLVAFDGRRVVKPVQFYMQNNYSAFIRRSEVLIYRASDVDLVEPVATVPLTGGATGSTEWSGELPESMHLRAGDELVYIVRAHGDNGAYDETFPRKLQLVRPEEAERGAQQLRRAIEQRYGDAFNSEQAQQQSLVDSAFGENSLRQQNIPIYGSRIRIQGRNLPAETSVTINGQSHPVDLERKLVAEYLVPVGQHRFEVAVEGKGGQFKRQLDIDVSGRYLFAVALADVTVSKNSASGSVEALGADADRLDDSLLVDGRLAFYLKGKVRGKYLVTAQADTQEREISELFNGFWDADPQDIFRRLDPNLYYPVYGDDSTVYRDVDTQGRLYLRVDWDKNQALWGNFNTGITGTEYGQYSRALYGGAFAWRSQRNTALGEPGTELRAFVSEAQTAPGHSEFLGTGASLYYLKHTDVLPGSERLVIEVRDDTTGRVENRIELHRGADYTINEMQGRIELSRPLLTRADKFNLPRLTIDTPLDGLSQVLLVDYEYVPTGFDPDDVTAGVRGKHWFGEHLAVGATYVDENRAGEDYTLKGADITLQAGRGTYLKLEQSRTQATSAPVFFSSNGGLSFTQRNAALGAREGDARAVEARVNFKELGWTQDDWAMAAWWRKVDNGYSISRFDQGLSIEERGAELIGMFGPRFQLYSRYSRAERGLDSLTQAQITGEWRIDENNTLSAELRRVDEEHGGGGPFSDAAGTLAALRYLRRIGSTWELYGTAQKTVDDDDGKYRDNDAVTLGGKYLFGDLSSVGAELTSGDRGDAAQINAEYRLTPDHSFYGAYTHSTDRSEYDPLFNRRQTPGWTFGQRWRLSNQVNLFNESQFLKEPDASGIAHTFGMDFFPAQNWNLGFTLQSAELDKDIGQVDRDAISLSGGHTTSNTQWQSKLEWRRDSGAEQREQWVSTNRVLHKFSESFRVAARVNYSKTEDQILAEAGAKFIEANLGFAWRPFDSTRWALLGKYTYLYDVSALEQEGPNRAEYDQRSQVLAFEGVYNPDNRWEYAVKLMRREGEVRTGRLQGEWADSAATFAAGQVRYEFGGVWHALAEYRWLAVKDGGDKQGVLFGIDRDIGQNFRIGLGYNFTEFSDDLTDFDYDHRGVFLNVVGKY
ncbi:hypothetical protein [Lysobacter sp. Hz 25]|uniref:hypothetical protein n=1 Tax=Lysobacter sp. Hz 25 TaxID=3383698 RepID=UPI0038D49CA8